MKYTEDQKKNITENMEHLITILGGDFPMRCINMDKFKDRIFTHDEMVEECRRIYNKEMKKRRDDSYVPYCNYTIGETKAELLMLLVYVVIGGIICLFSL